MPDEDVPAPESPPPDPQHSLLGNLAPDEMLARAMQTVRMTSGATGTWQPPSMEECAKLFPGYEVLRLLGRGGMGAVYQARQIELDRLVAIKLLPLEVSVDKDFADRFRREARAMAKLNHPNIILVHDFGTTHEGHLYFVMEFVEGANLLDIIRQVGLDGDQALSIAEQICTALAYAHNKGIVHRDIKPANVMIDTESHVKVADFGLARLTDPSAEQLGHTMTGTVMGTPDYMAPEQSKGMNVDHRADIYSVGVMLYEMMCREVPKGIFDPPSHRTGCDARIDQIVIRAMQQAPDRRYQSTTEMKADVSAARAPVVVPPVEARGPGVPSSPKPRVAGQPPRKPPTPGSPPKKPAVPVAAHPLPPQTAVMQAIKPPTPVTKSKLPLYGGIAAGVLAVTAGILIYMKTRSEPLTRAQIYAQEHAGASAQGREASPTVPTNQGNRGAASLPSAATKDTPFVNTLGMRFVPVPITGGPTGGKSVLFSVWDTRVQDYAVFAHETYRDWQKPDFEQGPTHPAVNVSWDDAKAFCDWLTAREHKSGKLPDDEQYRLPTDHEWSCAVGIGDREDAAKLPSQKTQGINDVFPWGTQWPPPKGAGNYAGEEAAGKHILNNQVIDGYNDGFVNTSPVGSFPPNQYGLYDIGGNAWQWCEDWLDKDQKRRVLRGASWDNGGRQLLLSSSRFSSEPNRHFGGFYSYSFRCVLAPATFAAPAASSAAPSAAGPSVHLSASGSALDLLPLVDVAKDAERGVWHNEGGNVVSDIDSHGREGDQALALPVRLSGSYAIEADFTRVGPQSDVRLLLPMGGSRSVAAQIQGHGDYAGLYGVRRMDETAANNPTATRNRLERGQRYHVEIVVIFQGSEVDIACSLGGNPLFHFQGPVADLASGKFALKDPARPGLGSISEVSWHSVRVRALEGGTVTPVRSASSSPAGRADILPATATKDAPFVNTLGMKFVPVPGTKVLFSIWDTRVQDYATYAAANSNVDGSWKTQNRDGVLPGREPDHPVIGVSWEDAQEFCRWLSHKETAEGKLPPGAKYRLPKDGEWSSAVGLPPEQGATPAERSGKNSVDFPWGKDYPPTRKVGNYGDEAFHAKFPKDGTDKTKDQPWIKGYDDGYATTSPVGSFPANAYGLYDMGGNVWQWCEDWYDASYKDRVLRGASWNSGDRYSLLSSDRARSVPGYRHTGNGFRCVLELAPAGADGGTRPGASETAPPAAVHLSPSGEPWVGAMNNSHLRQIAVREGEAWRMTDACKGLYLDLGPELTDGAVRMLFTADASVIGECAVQVRRASPTSFYNLHMEQGFQNISLAIIENGISRTLKTFRIPVEAQRPVDQPIELELRAVGTTLIAKVNGLHSFRFEDSKLTQGHLDFRLAPGVLLQAVQTLDLSKGVPAPVPAPEARVEPGFRPLFDGATLAGWRDYATDALPAGWSVAEGTIVAAGKRNYLVTKETFADFDLRLEWKSGPIGNSGIFFRIAPGEGQYPRTAPEFQLCTRDVKDAFQTGALYDVKLATEEASHPTGEWNTSRLVVQGGHCEHWVNERLVCTYDIGGDEWKKLLEGAHGLARNPHFAETVKGQIGLQSWSGEVTFRHIRIRTFEGNSQAAASDAFVREVATLATQEQQVARVAAELKKLNPEFDGAFEFRKEKGGEMFLGLRTEHLTDISPLRALTWLQRLNLSTPNATIPGMLKDLSPLRGLKLVHFLSGQNPVSDLTPLAGMPLEELELWHTLVTDYSPLRGLKLREFAWGASPRPDLNIFRDMPLEKISYDSGLQFGGPLTPSEMAILRTIPTLRKISGKPGEEISNPAAHDRQGAQPPAQ